MLWYLHLCADAKIVVTEYVDQASGVLMEKPNGDGHFTEIVWRPLLPSKKVEMQRLLKSYTSGLTISVL